MTKEQLAQGKILAGEKKSIEVEMERFQADDFKESLFWNTHLSENTVENFRQSGLIDLTNKLEEVNRQFDEL